MSTSPFDPDTHWPDGKPKRFRGKEAWKNWINWDSPFTAQTDELNRRRQFFFEVDGRGALWRLELDQPGTRFGQLRHPRVLDDFFGHVQRNWTGLFEGEFPFLSLRTHEHYFVRWADDGRTRSALEAPIVFNDLRDGELRHIVAGCGDVAASITTEFDPTALRLTEDGQLLHPVWTTAKLPRRLPPSIDAEADVEERKPERQRYWAAMDSITEQTILGYCEEDAGAVDGPHLPGSAPSGYLLRWEGVNVPLLLLKPESEHDSDC